MSSLGIHFALTADEVASLKKIRGNLKRLEYFHEAIEDAYFSDHPELTAESDKSWDAMHRALADGKLTWDGGEYPTNHTILAGEFLYTKSDYIMTLKNPKQVRDVAAALAKITKIEFKARYFAIDAKSYGLPLDNDDFEYTWHWFQAIRNLYVKAAELGRYVLFTADQ